MVLRVYLARQNTLRSHEPHDKTYDNIYVNEKSGDGNVEALKVDKVRVQVGLVVCERANEVVNRNSWI